jgi:hypothetical protein
MDLIFHENAYNSFIQLKDNDIALYKKLRENIISEAKEPKNDTPIVKLMTAQEAEKKFFGSYYYSSILFH